MTVLVEHEEGDVKVCVPVAQNQTVEQALGVAVDMVAASYRAFLEAPTEKEGSR